MLHILLFTLFYPVLGEYISLNGIWTLSNSTMDGISANVPGGVHTALMGAGILGDPYYRKNDAAYLWVGRGYWQYTRTFQVSNEILQMDMILLVCEGLDTIATVSINDKLVGKSDNMFVRYIFDVKSLVKETNTITIKFKSPVQYGKEKADASEYNIPPDCPPYYFHGECHSNMVRKTQCSFSWDWGPAFVTMGIWRDIYIQATDSSIITDVTTETIKHDGVWGLHVDIFIRASDRIGEDGQIETKIQDTDFLVTRMAKLNKGSQTLSENYDIPKNIGVVSWWPRGYGPQKMYNLTVTLKSKLGIVLASKTIRFAFRTVRLVEDPISIRGNDGLSFYFCINDRPLFLKGSNWIPADSFLERVTKERLRNYLQSAVDANMNTLRVWGGGIYELDYFYDLADELGILIWQDFMFACALYPVDEEFLSSVKEEVTYQVRRLKNHPSVFAYSGNNENEGAIAGNWWSNVYQNNRLKSDYVKLYIDTIQKIVKDNDPTRPYMSSSPSNGFASAMEGGLSSDPGNTRYGDIHYYDYRGAFFEDHTYKIPRMASEYGLESFPSIETLAPVYDRQDFSYESDLNEYRQHHAGGNREMEHFIATYMMPPTSNVEHQRFADIIYCTQIVQAVAMRTETEHYRRWQSELNDYGEGKTMGALYWMFADIWQAPSWSSIEYGGKWKMLHYYAMHFFSPVLISPFINKRENEDHLEVYVVVDELSEFQRTELADGSRFKHIDDKHNLPKKLAEERFPSWQKQSLLDLLKEKLKDKEEVLSLFSGTIYMRVYSWDSLDTKYTERLEFQLFKPAERIYKISVRNLVLKSGCGAAANCFVVLYMGDINNGHSTWYPLTTFKEAIGLREPNLKVEEVKTTEDPKVFELQLTTDAVSPFVWLEARGIRGRFSDNGFLMFLPRKTILFYAWEAIDDKTLKDTLTIKSLMHIYN